MNEEMITIKACEECEFLHGFHMAHCSRSNLPIEEIKRQFANTQNILSHLRKGLINRRITIGQLQSKLATLKHENNQLRKLVEKENAKHYKARLRDIVAMADKCLPSMPSGDAKDLVANFRIIAS